jgi:hypothetical protein
MKQACLESRAAFGIPARHSIISTPIILDDMIHGVDSH